jgi:Tfp pilus assembly protein PilF
MVNLREWILSYQNKDVGFNNIGVFISYIQEIDDIYALKSLLDLCFADTEIGIPILERVVELNPKDAQAWAWMGNMFWLNGEDENCREKLETARGIDPNSPDVRSLEELLGI